MSTSTVRLTIPAKAEYLILARLALAGIARQVPLSEAALADLKLAVTEACGNAVRHAYAADRGVVRVQFQIAPEAIEVCVEDDGSGLTEDRDDSPSAYDELPEHGMGLAIIRAIVDELDVEDSADGQGTLVRMRKQLGP